MLKEIPVLKTGQTIKVHQKIKEGKKERIQIFEGMIIAMKGKTPETKTITVRKVTQGIGVEKIYPIALPSLEKIEIVSAVKTRREKLYYLKRNYKKKLKDKKKK